MTATNTFGPLGLLFRYTGTASSSCFYAFDPSGNVAELENSSTGLLFAPYYDAFGRLSRGTDTPPFGFGGQFGYYEDYETGLVLAGHRYYDPVKARWINRDPIGYDGGLNLYGYAGDDPVKLADPSGLADRVGETGGQLINQSSSSIDVVFDTVESTCGGDQRYEWRSTLPAGWHSNPNNVDIDYIPSTSIFPCELHR